MVIKTVERIIKSTHIPIHHQILDISQKYMGLLMTGLQKKGCEVVGIKTDCVYVNNTAGLNATYFGDICWRGGNTTTDELINNKNDFCKRVFT